MTRRRRFAFGAAAGVVAALGATAWFVRGSAATVLSSAEPSVPTTRVVRGPLELSVHTVGDLRASKSVNLQAPAVGGGLLRLVKMAETGSSVHSGEVILEFDPTEQQYSLEQAQSQVAEAEQQVTKLKADRDVQAAQDRVDLLTAQFDVRRAELDARLDRDLVAASEYQKRQLSLEEAKRRLAQVEEGGKSRAETSRAALAVAEEARTKATLAAQRAQQNIESLTVKAPIDGFVVARENRDANSGIFYSGMTLPEYRAGDNVFPGRPVADVFDISQMEIRAKVNEQQRNNVAAGQKATVESAALPRSETDRARERRRRTGPVGLVGTVGPPPRLRCDAQDRSGGPAAAARHLRAIAAGRHPRRQRTARAASGDLREERQARRVRPRR